MWVATQRKDNANSQLSSCLIGELPAAQRHTLQCIVKSNESGQLTVLPLWEEGFNLSTTQFRDQLAICYHHEPSRLPPMCDGCGVPFSLQHGLNCAKGGLVKHGHNNLRNNDTKFADLTWGGVSLEPVIASVNIRADQLFLQADWTVKGVWEGNRVAFFDNRIIHADASSYVKTNLSWEAVANAKKAKYCLAIEDLRGSFTPLLCSTDGVLHREYAAYFKQLACRLPGKWEKLFFVVMAWVHAKTLLAPRPRFTRVLS